MAASRTTMLTVLVLTAGCLAGAAVIVGVVSQPSRRARVPPTSFGSIFIEAGMSLTSKPLPADGRYLSAEAAWARWEDGRSVPADVTARFGLLDDMGRYHLVWAYSEPGCAAMPGFASHFPPGYTPTCQGWVFLAPRTGRMILGIGGHIG